jgi:hypothetical protein
LTDPSPRDRLPDSWTGQGACPVCRARGRLSVVHPDPPPDHLACAACGSAFQVQAGGSCIRLVHLPPELAPVHSALLGVWLLPADLPGRVAAALAAFAAAAEPPVPAEPEPDDPARLLAELEDVAPPPSGDVDDVADHLLSLVSGAEPAPELAAEPAPEPPTLGHGHHSPAPSIHDLLYPEPAGAPEPEPEPAPDPPPAGEPAPAPPEPPLTAAEAATRALAERGRQLYELGNPLPVVRAALERTGASPEAVTAALADLQAQEDQRRSRQLRAYTLIGLAALLLVLFACAGVWLIANADPISSSELTAQALANPSITPGGPTPTPGGPTPTPTRGYSVIIELINLAIPGDVKLANGSSPTPGPTAAWFGALFPPTATLAPATATAAAAATATARATQGLSAEDDLPGWVRDLVPEGITVINVPTPSVSADGPAAASCPRTPAGAANLFGGQAQHWQFDRATGGWIVIVVGQPITLRVPANMSAGYLVAADSLEMRSTLGPATITNVNFAAVACD